MNYEQTATLGCDIRAVCAEVPLGTCRASASCPNGALNNSVARKPTHEGSRDPAPWQATSGQTLGRGSRSGQTRDEFRTKHMKLFSLDVRYLVWNFERHQRAAIVQRRSIQRTRCRAMKRCAWCHGRLGLGVRSRNLWNGRWWVHVRFCSTHCEAHYELERYDVNARRWRTLLDRSPHRPHL